MVGWREWASLPELNIPAIKVKVDTGAKTSALHAYRIEVFQREGKNFVRFELHPIQDNNRVRRTCEAQLIDQRVVKSSNGQKEKRYVIRTQIQLGGRSWEIDITLTNRDIMSYRMLLGREAMKKLVVAPSKSFCQGSMLKKDALKLYSDS